MIKKVCLVSIIALSSYLCQASESVQLVPFAKGAPIIDGMATNTEWHNSPWYPINFPIIGELPQKDDFNGNYRLLWDENYLYINVKMQDDVLLDIYPNPLERYWDDDCLEIFIDEDKSGGDHQTNYNAFAYHLALDGNVADIGPELEKGKTNFILLNDHVDSRWTRAEASPYTITWEVRVAIHNDSFTQAAPPQASRVKLATNKQMGFMMAYCDNDHSNARESFIGTHAITPVNGDMNLGFKTADVFGVIQLAR